MDLELVKGRELDVIFVMLDEIMVKIDDDEFRYSGELED